VTCAACVSVSKNRMVQAIRPKTTPASSRRPAFVSMVQAAYLRKRDDPTGFQSLDWSRFRRILLQSKVRSALVIIGRETRKVAAQAAFRQDDDMIDRCQLLLPAGKFNAAVPNGGFRRSAPSMGHLRPRSHLFRGVDATVMAMGLTILKTPSGHLKRTLICERVIGTIRRECLDWMIPCSERHLRRILQEWVGA
jgi:hypothetical protein